jgi:hypothetical protein
MASTYSSLKIELIGTGDQAGTWGATTNTNLGTALEEAITGSVNVAFSSADVTLTLTDTNATQAARNLRLNLTGTSGGARNLVVPAIEKQYIVYNNLADAVTVKNSSGTGIAVAAGKTMVVFNDATNVVDVTNYASSMALGTPLAATSGGTGVTSSTGTGSVVLSNSPTLVTPVLGVASATTVNKVALTAPATGSTITVADGKTLTASNSLTLAGTDSTTVTFPPASASVGYLNVPINSQSAAYTTVLADSGKVVLHPATDANARTFTIDSNANVAYALGTVITFINMTTEVLTIAITSDTMYLSGTGSTGSRSLAAYGMATAVKLTSTTWLISGNGLT